MKQLSILTLLLAGLHSIVFAQNLSIAGKIRDSAGLPVEAATASLLYAADSSLVKIERSDEHGRFEFSSIKAGSFLLGISVIGYEKFLGSPIEASESGQNIELPPIALKSSSIDLKAVTVTAKKLFIERRSDRTIVNVESSIFATWSTALEILERSPGVVVDQNDAISMRGRSGVIVMIDGKPNPMSGADLSNFLRTLPSNSIDRIELITNYNFRRGMNDLRLYRTFYENDVRSGAYDQRNYLTIPYNTHTARAGADFYPNKKTVLGVVASGNLNNFNSWIGQYSGNLANTTLSDGNLVAYFFTTHNFKLKNDWAAELSFDYKTREIYGFMDLNPMWGLGAGIQKSLFDRRATLKFAVTDIFWQNLPSATIRFNDYVETFEVFRETRVATLSFNYRFGSQQVQQARRRQGGAEDEKRRAGGGQG